MGPGTDVAIVCVPREVFSVTQKSLETLFERTRVPFDLVYVDGGSPPQTREYLEQAAGEFGFTLLRTRQFITPNQARNLSLAHVRTPFVVFIDNDVLVSEGWLEPLIDCARQTGAWAVAPLYFELNPDFQRIHMAGGLCQIRQEEDGRRYHWERHFHQHQLLADIELPIERQETELLEFHAVLVAMEAFEELGPLDEGLMCQSEHADFSLCIRQAGQHIFLEPESKITYMPPRRLTRSDRKFFGLRWSEAWYQPTKRHFIEKWDLAPEHEEVENSTSWVRHHRRYAFRLPQLLKKLISYRVVDQLQVSVLNDFEVWWSRWRYPESKYGGLSPVNAQVVTVAASHDQSAA